MVVGIDLGSYQAVIAVVQKGGIDVLLNRASNRTTEAMVSYGERERLIGELAIPQVVSNCKNVITHITCLLGRQFEEPDVQALVSQLPFTCVKMPNGTVGVKVMYLCKETILGMEQVLAAFLGHLKQLTEESIGTSFVDCVLSIPGYYTLQQRAAMLNAAQLAGLNALRLLHNTTATALQYGFYKQYTDEPVNVIFLDMGYSSFECAVVQFKKSEMRVLATGSDRNIGGFMIDQMLADHFIEEFKTKYKLDGRKNARAMVRLRQGVEKVKKVLSMNKEAFLNLECWMEDRDVSSKMDRLTFDNMYKSVRSRVLEVVAQTIASAGLTVDKVSSVEMVGGSMRMVALQEELNAYFGRPLARTMNMEECVARGCALMSAILSPLFKTKEYNVYDSVPFDIHLSWTPSEKELAANEKTECVIFSVNEKIPALKALNFSRSDPFTISLKYANPSQVPPGTLLHLGTYNMSAVTDPNAQGAEIKTRIKIRMTGDGLVVLEPPEASYSKTIRLSDEEVAKEREEKKKTKPAATPAPAPATPAPDSPDKMVVETPTPAEPEPITEEERTKIRKFKASLSVTNSGTPGLDAKTFAEFKTREQEMKDQDSEVRDTAEKKNQLESYIYTTRDKMGSAFEPFSTDKERSTVAKALDEVESWLYDEGEDQHKAVYVKKLKELKDMTDPIERRATEFNTRQHVYENALSSLHAWREWADTKEEKYTHITQEQRDTVRTQVDSADKWIREQMAIVNKQKTHEDPKVLVSDIQKKVQAVDKVCKPIKDTPKPKPKEEPKSATPAPTSPAPGSASEEKKTESEPANPKVEEVDPSTPMKTE